MSSELGHNCQVETRRWIWLIAVLFAMVIMAQYVELPYGNIVSYVLPDGRTQALLNGTSLRTNLSSYPNNVDNLTVLDNLNYTSTTSDNVKTATAIISDGKNFTQESNFTSRSNTALNNASLTCKTEDNSVPTEENGVPGDSSKTPSSASPLMSPTGVNLSTNNAVLSTDQRISPVNNDAQDRLHKTDGLGTPQSNNSRPMNDKPKSPQGTVLPVSDMINLLHKNRASSYSMVYLELQVTNIFIMGRKNNMKTGSYQYGVVLLLIFLCFPDI